MRSVSALAIASVVGLSAACAPEGSSGAYVSRNIPVGADCLPKSGSSIGLATGRYDVGTDDTAKACAAAYVMSLEVNSNLKANSRDSIGRVEPNVLQITHVDVRMMDHDRGTLAFRSADKVTPDSERPNPYRVLTALSLPPATSSTPQTGFVQIEAIPAIYAEKLVSFAEDDASIILELQVFGTTTGGVEVDFRPFEFPVALCRGCLSVCASEFAGKESDLTTLNAGECPDNAPQDGRVCIASGC